jgi:hypothetical protein
MHRPPPAGAPYIPQTPFPSQLTATASLRQIAETDLPEMYAARFTSLDDARLIALVNAREHPLHVRDWTSIAADMGTFDARRCRDRWDHYLKPPLNRADFSISERRQVLKLSILYGPNMSKIAAHLGDGTTRSPAMIRSVLPAMTAKIRKLGLVVKTAMDVDYLPDELFGWGFPRGDAKREILKEYRAAQEELGNDGALPIRSSLIQWDPNT